MAKDKGGKKDKKDKEDHKKKEDKTAQEVGAQMAGGSQAEPVLPAEKKSWGNYSSETHTIVILPRKKKSPNMVEENPDKIEELIKSIDQISKFEGSAGTRYETGTKKNGYRLDLQQNGVLGAFANLQIQKNGQTGTTTVATLLVPYNMIVASQHWDENDQKYFLKKIQAGLRLSCNNCTPVHLEPEHRKQLEKDLEKYLEDKLGEDISDQEKVNQERTNYFNLNDEYRKKHAFDQLHIEDRLDHPSKGSTSSVTQSVPTKTPRGGQSSKPQGGGRNKR